MEDRSTDSIHGRDSVDITDVLEELVQLEESLQHEPEAQDIRKMRRMLERVPGPQYIKKYTTRDIAEGFVGGIIFSLPLLVEDGVFEIAEWFTTVTIGPIPVFLLLNMVFVVGIVAGLLYFTDIREIKISRPIFGFIPRRLVGVLLISFIVAASTMLLWGRLHEEDPSQLEAFGRITVIWAAAALGATLGDILPGESKGHDISNIIGGDSEQ